jgi:hypothetical protein
MKFLTALLQKYNCAQKLYIYRKYVIQDIIKYIFYVELHIFCLTTLNIKLLIFDV